MAGDTDLIASIYDAIIDPSRWDEVVRRIVEATKSVAGFLAVRREDAGGMLATCNADPFYTDLFARHYYKINFVNAAGAAIAPGEVRSVTSITQSDSFKASAICNDIMRHQGWVDCVAVGLFHTPEEFGLLILNRSSGAFWVEPPERQLLEILGPHLKRAAEVHQLLSRARAVTESLGAAVAGAGFAVFLLSEDCGVLFANSKAEDLVRCQMGFHYEHGRLAGASPALTARLKTLARAGSVQTPIQLAIQPAPLQR